MRTRDLHFDLPPERIAQSPAEPRDSARLMVVHRASDRIEHRTFAAIGEYIAPGDALVLNDTRVLPARFWCRRASGARIEALYLSRLPGEWRVLLRPSARLRPGESLDVEGAPAQQLKLLAAGERGEWSALPSPEIEPLELLERCGQPPLPPYLKAARQPRPMDRERYQTVFARAPGAVAAPTAGLHFTPALLDELRTRGVHLASVTLHVGLGTFAPITAEDLSQHVMHAEDYEVPAKTVATLERVRRTGHRIVAVGTTSARTLESIPGRFGSATDPPPDTPDGLRGSTQIFLYPPYGFRNVDRLITNFHLPGSTLLAMVMALAGVERIREAYAIAVREGYRFYSYGDAMLIL